MAILGEGEAHGACSLLHAAALGYGASLALNLPITVRLLDKPSKNELNDEDNLLSFVFDAWDAHNAEYPHGLTRNDLHWSVRSKIPKKQGLKSSSALCVAAVRALSDAVSGDLSEQEIVRIAIDAQIRSGISLTGSMDDTWACATPGWKLIDTQAPFEEHIILEGDGPKPDDWTVLLLLRGERNVRPAIEDFIPHQAAFQQALVALQDGNELVALTWNGRGMASVLNDIQGRKMSNDSFVVSARAAGITGSGPAIVIVVPNHHQPTIDRITSWYTMRNPDVELIETNFLPPRSQE